MLPPQLWLSVLDFLQKCTLCDSAVLFRVLELFLRANTVWAMDLPNVQYLIYFVAYHVVRPVWFWAHEARFHATTAFVQTGYEQQVFYEVRVLVVDWVCFLVGFASHIFCVFVQLDYSHIHFLRRQNIQLLVRRDDGLRHFSPNCQCGTAQNGHFLHWLLRSHDSTVGWHILANSFHWDTVLSVPHFVLYLVRAHVQLSSVDGRVACFPLCFFNRHYR